MPWHWPQEAQTIPSIVALDHKLFLIINGMAGRWPVVDSIARLIGNDYFMPVAMSLVLLWLWFDGSSSSLLERQQKAVMAAFVAMGLTNLVIKFINWNFYRLRPFQVLDNTRLLFYQPTDSSFPSNSAAVAFTMAVAVMLANRRMGTVLLIMALLWALSRIYMGVHFPLDIIAGAALGYVSSLLVSRLLAVTEPWPSLILGLLRRAFLA
ncbi:MAG: phosphatase PAP2 family protein [Chloroflexi bacterium]|nr:phosphatase PAP2 family protein [Chloroflexota bacterium]